MSSYYACCGGTYYSISQNDLLFYVEKNLPIVSLKKELSDLASQVNKWRLLAGDKEKRLNQVVNQITQLEAKVNELGCVVDESKRLLNAKNRDLDTANNLCADLTKQTNELNVSLVNCNEKIIQHEENDIGLHSRIEALERLVKERDEKINEQKQLLVQKNNDLKVTESRCVGLTSQISTLEQSYLTKIKLIRDSVLNVDSNLQCDIAYSKEQQQKPNISNDTHNYHAILIQGYERGRLLMQDPISKSK